MGAFLRVRAAGPARPRHKRAERRGKYPANLPLALALVLAVAGSAAPSVGSEHARTVPASAPEAASVTLIAPQSYPAAQHALPPAIRIAATGSGRGATKVAVADVLLKAYRSAAAGAPPSCHLPASLLAAIGEVESGSLAGRTLDGGHRTSIFGPVLNGSNGFRAISDTDHGRLDGNRTWDRAMGPLQFIPSTWRTFGVDADGDGTADPQDVEDATATAAGYLCYGGRDLSDPATLRSAVLAYNASSAYQRLVLTYQKRFASFGLDGRTTVVGLSVGAAGGPIYGQALPGQFSGPSGSPTNGPSRHDGKKRDKTVKRGGAGASDGSAAGGATGGTSKDPTKEPSSKPTKKPSKDPTKTPSGTPSGTPTDDPTTCPPPDPSAPGSPAADPSAEPSTGTGDGDTVTCPPCGTTGDPSGDPSGDPTAAPTPEPDPTAGPGDPIPCVPVTEPSSSAAP